MVTTTVKPMTNTEIKREIKYLMIKVEELEAHIEKKRVELRATKRELRMQHKKLTQTKGT